MSFTPLPRREANTPLVNERESREHPVLFVTNAELELFMKNVYSMRPDGVLNFIPFFGHQRKVAKHGRARDRGPRSSGRGCGGCRRRSCSLGVRLEDDHDPSCPDDLIILPEGMSILSPWLAMMITVPFSETRKKQ